MAVGIFLHGNLQEEGSKTRNLDSENSELPVFQIPSINEIVQDTPREINPYELELLIHRGINQERQKQGLSQLEYDEKLAGIARAHSEDMGQNNYFSHDSPSGETMEDRYAKAGYNCKVDVGSFYYVGAENITQQWTGKSFYSKEVVAEYNTADAIAVSAVKGWMNSQGHRENILAPFWRKEGIGAHIEGTKIYITQNFC